MLFFGVSLALAQRREQTLIYIENFGAIAVSNMQLYKIPASIKLAQGIVESGSGMSRLAREANNHFGIKCKADWRGEKIYHDDDQEAECFRKYDSAEESYRDHSLFLTASPRYSSLFELDITDYRGWANGLKRAGYATNPLYAQMLIKTIEDYELYRFDRASPQNDLPPPSEPKVSASASRYGTNNGVKYVVVGAGESMEQIAESEGLTLDKLLAYNDLSAPVAAAQGEALYIEAKLYRSLTTKKHKVAKDETLHSISQKYGIALDALLGMNPRLRSEPLRVGMRLKLK